MLISLIVGHDLNGTIGRDNKMPWPRLKKDMRWFRKHTLGKTIVMGRKTHQSIGCTLADRHNIMLTRDTESGCFRGTTVRHSVEGAIKACHETDELVVIGGAQIYELFMPRVQRIYRTLIHQSYRGDTYFKGPQKNWTMEWDRTYHEVQEERGIRLDFEVYERP